MKPLRSLAVLATIVTFLAMVQGRIVTATGASTACPDWPLCHGQIIPQLTDRLVFYEWSHRLLVLISTLLMITIVAVAWRRGGALRAFAIFSLVVVLLTAWIGGMSILMPISLALTALDTALALLYFASLVALTVWSFVAPAEAAPAAAGSHASSAASARPPAGATVQ